MGPELEENCSENTFKEVHRALVNVDALPELFPSVHDTLQASLALPVPLIQNIKVFESEMEMRSHLASPFTVRTRTVVCAAPPAAPATRGKLLLSNQIPVTCVALTLGVVWKPLNLKPRPKSGIQSTLVMWTWKVVRKSGHLLVHSTSQSIPPLLPASFPGAWHWLWSLLAHGPSNGKLRLDSCQWLVSFPN